MRYFIWVFFLFFTLIFSAHAIPAPFFVVGYDVVLLGIPFLLTTLSFVYFYFKKYLWVFVLVLIVFWGIMYAWHWYVTQQFFYSSYEFFLWIWIIFCYFILKQQKFFLFILFSIVLVLNFIFAITWYKVFDLFLLSNRISSEISQEYVMSKKVFRDNYVVVYATEKSTGKTWYTVVQNVLNEDEFYLEKWGYFIVYGWEKEIGKMLSKIAFNVIK